MWYFVPLLLPFSFECLFLAFLSQKRAVQKTFLIHFMDEKPILQHFFHNANLLRVQSATTCYSLDCTPSLLLFSVTNIGHLCESPYLGQNMYVTFVIACHYFMSLYGLYEIYVSLVCPSHVEICRRHSISDIV